MSNTISVNLENLTDAERQQLVAIVEKSQKPKKWWKDTKFDVKRNEEYEYIHCDGTIRNDTNINSMLDSDVIAFGNACKDKAYMKRRAKEIKLYNLLSNFAEVVNEGWKPNWKDDDEMKCHILHHHYDKKWVATATYICRHPNGVYFKSEELAQRAIDEIVLPFERGEL